MCHSSQEGGPAVIAAGFGRRKMPSAVPTHILGGFPQDVPHAATIAQAVVEDRDNAHEQSVTGTFPLLWVSFWGGEQSKGSEHRQPLAVGWLQLQ